jgi:RNA polymerase sigma factor (TIGR02999 family)
MADAHDITLLLRAYEAGDKAAFDRLVPLVYDELRRMAHRHLRRGPRGATLDTTGLVHEAYLKLVRSPGLRLNDRGHLMAVTARAMRQVVVSRARARLARKRGGGEILVTLDERTAGAIPPAAWLLDLDRALEKLRERDELLARVFECRFFAGLGEQDTAESVGIPLRTAQRAWLRARAWLRRELAADAPGGSSRVAPG